MTVTYRELHERALLLAGSLLAGVPARPSAVGVLAGKGRRRTRRSSRACTPASPWSRSSPPSRRCAPGR
ncbi:hypothetical protein NKH77_06135 [Streptomyces sp. M19]